MEIFVFWNLGGVLSLNYLQHAFHESSQISSKWKDLQIDVLHIFTKKNWKFSTSVFQSIIVQDNEKQLNFFPKNILPMFYRECPLRLSNGIICIFQNVCNLLINRIRWHLSVLSPPQSSALYFSNSSIYSWLGRYKLQLPGGCSMVVTQMGHNGNSKRDTFYKKEGVVFIIFESENWCNWFRLHKKCNANCTL